MADLTITAANVIAGAGASLVDMTAGATVTAGQTVYKEAATGLAKLADCDSGTAEARTPIGIALNGAATGQPVKVLKSGLITIGATMTAGVTYYQSPVAGGICPIADVLSGDTTVIVGIATSTSVLKVGIVASGVTL